MCTHTHTHTHTHITAEFANTSHTHFILPTCTHAYTTHTHTTHTHTTHTPHTHTPPTHTHTEGTPGAVTGVVQVGPPSLYCATVGWSGAPSSSDNPITLFTVTLSTERGVTLTTADISAEDAPLQSTFCDLQPGTAYKATVIAQNTFGYGDPSPSVAIQTAVPIGTLWEGWAWGEKGGGATFVGTWG